MSTEDFLASQKTKYYIHYQFQNFPMYNHELNFFLSLKKIKIVSEIGIPIKTKKMAGGLTRPKTRNTSRFQETNFSQSGKDNQFPTTPYLQLTAL